MGLPCSIQRWHVIRDRSTTHMSTVYVDGDPEIVDFMQLASWKQLSSGLYDWEVVSQSPQVGCQVLEGPALLHAKNRCISSSSYILAIVCVLLNGTVACIHQLRIMRLYQAVAGQRCTGASHHARVAQAWLGSRTAAACAHEHFGQALWRDNVCWQEAVFAVSVDVGGYIGQRLTTVVVETTYDLLQAVVGVS